MQKARCHIITMLQPLVGVQFQELFTPLFRVLFTFPSRYLFAIGLLGVFSLTRWCWQIQREFHRLPPTQDTTSILYVSFTRLSLSLACLSKQFYSRIISIMQSYNPNFAVTKLVWANPCSLATTQGITIVFSSSRYLDVSVPWVCSLTSDRSSTCRVAPFGYLRITSYVPIPAAFRSLSRPSSPLRAQAFPIRPYLAYCTFCLFNEF